MADPTSDRNTEAAAAAGILDMTREQLLQEARKLKEQLSSIEVSEDKLQSEIDSLAIALPNFTSDQTPRGDEPKVLGYINDHPEPNPSQSDRVWRSHSHIGSELSLLDFSSAATTSGWGWYNLLNGAALLEQALIQYAISVAVSHNFTLVIPPSIVYSHIAAACGFQPRDQNDEMQIYALQQPAADVGKKPELCLAGTAEIPLAGMFAKSTVDVAALPIKRAAVSRCYRAEAGARGVDTKGLYRVHEFTKIELFGWTAPSLEAATEVFNEIVSIQKTILENLGLHCQILEQPSTDLGASAIRKIDIEAFFPSRRQKGDGFGEVTSASICTDYQTRRLATRLQRKDNKLGFPFTVNGTAIAVPRVLAAILENGWDEERKIVKVPEVLWPWMHGIKEIEGVKRVTEED
jgi:seryl-tRNA synthetase